ncbi:MAG: hypothetical protein IJX30_00075 [Clostridia bacterium]|nr:hypothetical protein [Clostridia bacterium]
MGTNFIRITKIEELKKYIKALYEQGKSINVNVKKTRTKGENHDVVIEGIYPKFFTVKNTKMNLAFTIQYIDIITGNIAISEIE